MQVNVIYNSVRVELVYLAPPATRPRCKSIRRCRFGYEFGYYTVGDGDVRTFVRVGIARTYTRAAAWLEFV